jgi:hypothetical protein
MMTKEFLQSLLKIVPDEWQIEFDIKGKGETLVVVWIKFDHDANRIVISLADEHNMPL